MIRVVQTSFHRDRQERAPDDLPPMWWRTLEHLATGVARAGVEVEVVQPGAEDRVIERDGVRYQFLAEPPDSVVRRRAGLWASRARRRVERHVAALRPDVIHVQSFSFPRHVRRLRAAVPQAPILVQDRLDPVPAWWLRGMAREGLSHAAGAAFTARELAEPFFAARVLPAGFPIFEVVGVSSSFAPGDQAAARAATGLVGDPVVLWLGRMDANKDPLGVLEAFRRALPALPDARLWCCCGTPSPLLPAVERRVAADPLLSAHVRILGLRPHDEIETLLRAADFLIQGSHRESTGVVAIEALACGTTPLVTAIPSFRRITAEGAVGGLARPGDVDGMACNLVEWARGDRAELRRRARAHFERALSVDRMGEQLRGAYEALRRRR